MLSGTLSSSNTFIQYRTTAFLYRLPTSGACLTCSGGTVEALDPLSAFRIPRPTKLKSEAKTNPKTSPRRQKPAFTKGHHSEPWVGVVLDQGSAAWLLGRVADVLPLRGSRWPPKSSPAMASILEGGAMAHNRRLALQKYWPQLDRLYILETAVNFRGGIAEVQAGHVLGKLMRSWVVMTAICCELAGKAE